MGLMQEGCKSKDGAGTQLHNALDLLLDNQLQMDFRSAF